MYLLGRFQYFPIGQGNFLDFIFKFFLVFVSTNASLDFCGIICIYNSKINFFLLLFGAHFHIYVCTFSVSV